MKFKHWIVYSFSFAIKHKCCILFQGSTEACDKAASLDVFTNAETIKINPDKPQEQARFLTLEVS